jgi:ribosomal protein L3 glutamine methyltransferase
MTELKTIRDIIRWATSKFYEAGIFFGHGTESAWDEAVALVFHTLHLPHELYAAALDTRITDDERTRLLVMINKRITHRLPLPYLTHEAWFSGLSFYVDERVLIPRSPIAELIESHFQPWIDEENVNTILDLCTGSACIAIACAKAFPDASVDASDISESALAVAKINLLRHHLESDITLFHSDLFEKIPAKQYDIIVSNPPYVDAEDMQAIPDEFKHEPSLALAAGTDGLDIIVKMLQQSGQYLSPNGIVVFEVGNSEVALAEKFPEIPFTWLEFQRGGGGVFTLTAEQLKQAQPHLSKLA